MSSTARLSAKFMLEHPAHFIAMGFGSGLSPVAPGTVGTLFAWICFHVINQRFPSLTFSSQWLVVIAVCFVIGIWACHVTGKHCGVSDHGAMVWDEIVAFWLVLAFIVPSSFATQCWAFLIFRALDMAKPHPIAWFDANIKGGLGVMWDDIVAAFLCLLGFSLWRLL